MSIGVRIQVDPDGGVLSALSKLALEGSDKTSLLDQIGITLSENTRLRFGDQMTPDGTPWVQSLRAKAQSGETLRDTGRLMASITHVVNGDTMEFGTNVKCAPFLHFGATIRPVSAQYLAFKIPGGGWVRKKEVTLPARPFLGVSDEDGQEVIELIGQFIKTRVF